MNLLCPKLRNPKHHALLFIVLLSSVLLSVSDSALAHHPLDGMDMRFFWHGLVSGIAHPLLGIDHLFFIIAIAVTGVFSTAPLRTLGVVLVGVFAGILFAMQGLALGRLELLVALTLVAIGVYLLVGLKFADGGLLLVLAAFSVVHGIAYGQVLSAQMQLPVVVVLGFVTGLPLIYIAVMFVIRWLAFKAFSAVRLPGEFHTRFIGAVVAITGLLFV